MASCPLERMALKLKRLAKALQSWGHKRIDNVKSQLGLDREILHRLEIAQDNRLLCGEEIWLKGRLKQHCLGLLPWKGQQLESDRGSNIFFLERARDMRIISLRREGKRSKTDQCRETNI
jgi:hypothetical protein